MKSCRWEILRDRGIWTITFVFPLVITTLDRMDILWGGVAEKGSWV
jgi:hypothetical protein